MVKQQCDEDDATRGTESDREQTRDARPKAQQRSGPAPIAATVAQLSGFDEVIDVRSEGEYAEDHIPGALNCPVLDNAERVLVGTIYKQRSSFDAKKIGAALVSANISRHLRERFAERPREWRPLVYCWRGGGRSGALAHVLAQVGWRVGQLEGGYKAYRRAVMADLETLPHAFQWRVVCGMTGTGKSRLLRALADRGEQVLDLEALAAHRGSILGNLPDEPQPTQKMFDSLVRHVLARFDRDRPVFVEAESRKIGRLRVPEALIEAMWRSECLVLDAPIEVRVALLQSEYAHYVAQPDVLIAQIECLTALHGRETISRWQALSREGNSAACVEALLVRHYDPAYTRSTLEHYPALAHAPHFEMRDTGEAAFTRLAAEVAEHTR
ncbi:MAG: tRNA 2-selenouridine(34) synthase MnmH [Betaproteobacteria bacterium]|nr:tRNA 2-selenouridine(34) synthase MnmH [Betaproteobacteria bacterium]